MKRVNTEQAEILFRDDDVLEYHYSDGAVVGLPEARRMVDAALDLVGEAAPCPTVVVAGDVKVVTREARQFFAESEENRAISSCVGLVVTSPVARVIGNFFMGLNKPRVPTRLFKTVDDAVRWVKQAHRA